MKGLVSAMKYTNENADKNKFSGPRYQVMTAWTDGSILLPEALTWLWKD